MLKKLVGAALAAILVVGMSSVTMAAENVKFSVQSQALIANYTPGTKDATTGKDNPSYLDMIERTDFEFKFIQGKMYVYGEISQQYTNQNATWDAPWGRIGLNLAPGMFIEIGKVWVGAPFSFEFDGVTTKASGWGYRSGWCCQSDHGLKFNMVFMPTMGIMAAYTVGNTMTGAAEGTSIGVSWWAVFGPIQARVGYDSETAQDVTAVDSKGYGATYMYAGVKASFGPMAVSFDLLTQSRAAEIYYGATRSGKFDNSLEYALVFSGKQLGPMDFGVQYAVDTDTKSEDSKGSTVNTYINGYVKFPISKQAGVEALYLSKKTVVTDSTGSAGDATGPSAIGGGFYARF